MSTTKTPQRAPKDPRSEALDRVVSLLLRGVALRSFCSGDAELKPFQGKIRSLREEIAQIDDEDTGFLVVGSNTGRGRQPDYDGSGDPATAARRKELDASISMISESLLSVARTTQDVSLNLRESEEQIATGTTADEVAVGIARLSVSLETIRRQVLRRNDALLTPDRKYPPNEIDQITGLPGADPALQALTAAWKHKKRYCAAAIGVRRLDIINARFGFAAGDEMLGIAAQHLVASFGRDYLLFRWRGPCMLCIIEKKVPEPLIQNDIKRAASVRLEQNMTMNNREAIVTVFMSWKMIPLEGTSVDDAVQRIENFMIDSINFT